MEFNLQSENTVLNIPDSPYFTMRWGGKQDHLSAERQMVYFTWQHKDGPLKAQVSPQVFTEHLLYQAWCWKCGTHICKKSCLPWSMGTWTWAQMIIYKAPRERAVPSAKRCKGKLQGRWGDPAGYTRKGCPSVRAAEARKTQGWSGSLLQAAGAHSCLVGRAGDGPWKAGSLPNALRSCLFLVKGDALGPSGRSEGCPRPIPTSTGPIQIPSCCSKRENQWRRGELVKTVLERIGTMCIFLTAVCQQATPCLLDSWHPKSICGFCPLRSLWLCKGKSRWKGQKQKT